MKHPGNQLAIMAAAMYVVSLFLLVTVLDVRAPDLSPLFTPILWAFGLANVLFLIAMDGVIRRSWVRTRNVALVGLVLVLLAAWSFWDEASMAFVALVI